MNLNTPTILSDYYAVVDLGSNSFRLQIARLEHGQLVTQDYYKEPVRLGAGLDERGYLTPESIARSVACLTRFAERLRGIDPSAVRAVATQSLRAAKNPADFLTPAQAALGYPIEVISGQEEARLIYLGVSHDLPNDGQSRLVVDIGGGSTELIVGRDFHTEQMDSLRIGCVSQQLKFFDHQPPTERTFKRAVLAAMAVFEEAQTRFGQSRAQWHYAVGSSGTVEAIAQLCVWVNEGVEDSTFPITMERMERVMAQMLGKEPRKWAFFAMINEQRAQVLAGGLAVLMGLFRALGVTQMRPCYSALRQGVMIDLLGQTQIESPFAVFDVRGQSIERLQQRFGIDVVQAQRVSGLAQALLAQMRPDAANLTRQRLQWAAATHEIGMSVSHEGYHRHGAYLMRYSDVAGFSRFAQSYLADLIAAQVGGLRKHAEKFTWYEDFAVSLLSLRLAVLLAHARVDAVLPQARLSLKGQKIHWQIEAQWVTAHPLTAYLLDEEWRAWEKLGFSCKASP